MDETIEETAKPSIRDQFLKMMLGVAAGFVATKLVENAYDKVVTRRNSTENT
jgi:hypothetical protein